MYSTTISFAILAALAVADSIQLFAESDDKSVNGLGLSSIHEGAAINYFFLSSGGAETLQYDEKNGEVYSTTSDSVKQSVSIDAGNFLQLSAADFQKVDFSDDDTVSVNGNDEFFAAKNVKDPYNYSKDSYAILNKSSDGSIKIKIKAKQVADSSSSASAAPQSSGAPAVSTISGNGANAKAAGSFIGAAAFVAALI